MMRLKSSEQMLYEELANLLDWYLKKEAHPDLGYQERIDAARKKLQRIRKDFFEQEVQSD